MSSQPETPKNEPVEPSRILLVSNKLSVSVKADESGGYKFSRSPGGLNTAVSALAKSTPFQWYGWPGLEVAEEAQSDLTQTLKEEYDAIPVYLEEKTADLYYNKFANSILWPLLHYHPGEITFSEEAWQEYKTANRIFAQTVARDVKEGDLVWIHDYHLFLVPQMLREEVGPNINFKIGFFLHTNFPSSEIYRILPVRVQILRGMLQSDLIGFHTYDYARHFLSSCWTVLGVPTTTHTITYLGRIINVGVFPIGIDPELFTDTLHDPEAQDRITALEAEFTNKQVMVGVDRLDYVKGIPQKMRAFEIMLETHPELVGKVVLVQVAVPSRGEVEIYKNLRIFVNELVGRINGKFGSFSYSPIHFLHQSVDFPELVALYSVAEVCVVASTRDGMNLVSFEYVACQSGRHGSLILSEFAGAAQSLAGAIVVNPWNEEEMARAMAKAVTMGEEERQSRWSRMNGHVTRCTAAFWGESFVKELMRAGEEKKADSSFLQVSHDPLPTRIDWRNYDGESGV